MFSTFYVKNETSIFRGRFYEEVFILSFSRDFFSFNIIDSLWRRSRVFTLLNLQPSMSWYFEDICSVIPNRAVDEDDDEADDGVDTIKYVWFIHCMKASHLLLNLTPLL
jgi:hypothetical protein